MNTTARPAEEGSEDAAGRAPGAASGRAGERSGGRFRVAAIQMVSEPAVEANLAAADELIGDAAAQGAVLVALPEWFCFIGAADTDKLALAEGDGDGPIQSFLARAAAKHRVWLIGGSLPLAAAVPGKVHNTCCAYDPDGRRVARYDKIHLFDFADADRQYRESATIAPGRVPVAFDSPHGRIALSICYDVRFPELYRRLVPMDLVVVPSAFTVTTGRAHWETLLRARAVENLAWVVAPAQGGRHATGRETYGHTMVIDPWGKVVAAVAHGPGIALAEVDPTYQCKLRADLPALSHRVL